MNASDPGNLNVRAFGAAGDGKTNDTAAIQRALDAAGKVEGTVHLPPGVYLCGELHMHPGTALAGTPVWDYRRSRGAILKLDDSASECLLNMTGAYGAAALGVCLQGRGAGEQAVAHGIMVNKGDYGRQEDVPRIDGCKVEGFSGDGVRLERIWCFSIRHSHLMHNGGCGLRVRGWDGFILDNWFSGNGMCGYGAYDENASITMTGNRVEWNHKDLVVDRGGHGEGVVIADNVGALFVPPQE